jgi:hypothetical protein
MEAAFGASTSTVEVKEISKALAVGSRVAIRSREEETPRIEIDFADFEKLFISVPLSFSHHPPAFTHGLAPWPISLK